MWTLYFAVQHEFAQKCCRNNDTVVLRLYWAFPLVTLGRVNPRPFFKREAVTTLRWSANRRLVIGRAASSMVPLSPSTFIVCDIGAAAPTVFACKITYGLKSAPSTFAFFAPGQYLAGFRIIQGSERCAIEFLTIRRQEPFSQIITTSRRRRRASQTTGTCL